MTLERKHHGQAPTTILFGQGRQRRPRYRQAGQGFRFERRQGRQGIRFGGGRQARRRGRARKTEERTMSNDETPKLPPEQTPPSINEPPKPPEPAPKQDIIPDSEYQQEK